MSKIPFTSQCRQTGFTIIEIMVALVVSSILLIGVLNIFLAGKQSYTLQTGMARLQENARYAFDIMSQSISRAGMDIIDTTGGQFVIIPVDPFGAATANGAGSASDTISVQYWSTTDCLGAATAANPTPNAALDTFAVVGDALQCNGTDIVDGIDNMQILYGVDTTHYSGADPGTGSPLSHPELADPIDGIPETYVPFSAVPSVVDNDLKNGGVVSVRIAILVKGTATSMNSVQEVNNTIYTLLDAPALPAFGDRSIRRVFIRTVLLRNFVQRPRNPRY